MVVSTTATRGTADHFIISRRWPDARVPSRRTLEVPLRASRDGVKVRSLEGRVVLDMRCQQLFVDGALCGDEDECPCGSEF